MTQSLDENVMKNKNTSFHGNPLLKSSGESVMLTKEHIKELAKCMNDPIYFAENYVYVISVDRGKEIINLYPYQKKALQALKDHRYTILLSCRQSGKCLFLDTVIKIKNPNYNNGLPFEMKIGDFYNWQKLREDARNKSFESK